MSKRGRQLVNRSNLTTSSAPLSVVQHAKMISMPLPAERLENKRELIPSKEVVLNHFRLLDFIISGLTNRKIRTTFDR
jgi:hypothetical protein